MSGKRNRENFLIALRSQLHYSVQEHFTFLFREVFHLQIGISSIKVFLCYHAHYKADLPN
jgi:hypothetical protein